MYFPTHSALNLLYIRFLLDEYEVRRKWPESALFVWFSQNKKQTFLINWKVLMSKIS